MSNPPTARLAPSGEVFIRRPGYTGWYGTNASWAQDLVTLDSDYGRTTEVWLMSADDRLADVWNGHQQGLVRAAKICAGLAEDPEQMGKWMARRALQRVSYAELPIVRAALVAMAAELAPAERSEVQPQDRTEGEEQ